jgi:cardiolipin synthase
MNLFLAGLRQLPPAGGARRVPMNLFSLFRQKPDPAAERPKRPRNQPLRVSTPWIIIALLLVGAGVLFYESSAKIIQLPISNPVSVTDPLFRESFGPLLGAEFSGGNTVQPLLNGREIFPAMLAEIRQAKKSITLESYIWSSGRVSDQFCTALMERAKAGVKIHALVDGAGDFKIKLDDIIRLKEAGVQFFVYARQHWYDLKFNVNHRTHRKLLVIDGKVGFTGGVCIDDTWMGNGDRDDIWRETQARIEGPVVREMQAVFATNWLQTTSRLLIGPDYFPDTTRPGSAYVDCFKSGPGENPENARLSYLVAIASAKKSIRLAHAYFVPDDLTIEMLLAARQRGVKVEIIVPARNDSSFGRAVSRSRWKQLMEAGVEFHQYLPSLYHCKLMIVDDAFITLGSVNFDNRSFSINDEVNINVVDPGVVNAFLVGYNDDLRHSKPLTATEFAARPFWQKIIDQAAGVFRSQF